MNRDVNDPRLMDCKIKMVSTDRWLRMENMLKIEVA
uniref:Uncharacterized protein n=1 Tax=Tetranychus urticae TaxID=32264 RepID=T1JQX5_TETUR